MVMEHASRGSRLLALSRLLVYALAESEELGLADLEKLLSAAALAISDGHDNAKARWSIVDASCRRPRSKP
jgi:hypothetical protein